MIGRRKCLEQYGAIMWGELDGWCYCFINGTYTVDGNGIDQRTALRDMHYNLVKLMLNTINTIEHNNRMASKKVYSSTGMQTVFPLKP